MTESEIYAILKAREAGIDPADAAKLLDPDFLRLIEQSEEDNADGEADTSAEEARGEEDD